MRDVIGTIVAGVLIMMEQNATANASGPTSPPTKVDAWDLADDFEKINQQWASIVEVLEHEDYYNIRSDGVSAWSCGEQAAHLAIVNTFIAENIEQNLAHPERDKDGEQIPIVQQVLKGGTIPRGAGKAPAELKPEGKTREDYLAMFKTARAAWGKMAEVKGQLPGCPARFKHFAFGQLTSVEWVRLSAIHNAHHLKIIRDILKAAGKTDAYGKAIQAPIEE